MTRFYKQRSIVAQVQILLNNSQIFWKMTLLYLTDKKVFEMLFEMSAIVLKTSRCSVLNIFKFSYF